MRIVAEDVSPARSDVCKKQDFQKRTKHTQPLCECHSMSSLIQLAYTTGWGNLMSCLGHL